LGERLARGLIMSIRWVGGEGGWVLDKAFGVYYGEQLREREIRKAVDKEVRGEGGIEGEGGREGGREEGRATTAHVERVEGHRHKS
jgi:hypothetical protein